MTLLRELFSSQQFLCIEVAYYPVGNLFYIFIKQKERIHQNESAPGIINISVLIIHAKTNVEVKPGLGFFTAGFKSIVRLSTDVKIRFVIHGDVHTYFTC